MIKVIAVLFTHYVLDYPLQGDFLAQTKGKYGYSLFAHSMIYAMGMSLCLYFLGVLAPIKVAVLLASHYGIDYVKSHAKDKEKALTSYLYIDQGLHIGLAILLLYV